MSIVLNTIKTTAATVTATIYKVAPASSCCSFVCISSPTPLSNTVGSTLSLSPFVVGETDSGTPLHVHVGEELAAPLAWEALRES